MNRVLPFLLLLTILFSGCGSSKKQLQKGNYDAAIDKAVKQLRKDPEDIKQIDILTQSYRIANEQNMERIKYLKLEGRPDAWDEVYLNYKTLADRQSLVRTVTPLNMNGKSIDFPYVDYMTEMVNAKRKAADFYYTHGSDLMKNGSKESYRQAYAEFIRAKDYVGDYPGIDNMISESRYRGMTRVLISLQNSSIIRFPAEFEEQLLALDLPSINTEWVDYYTRDLDKEVTYDYLMNINIRNVAVGPDQMIQRDSVIKRDVEDGFSYTLDKKGNVMKDSLGNDIKVKKYKTLQCALIETVQMKACRIDGDIELVQTNPQKVVKKDPLGAQSNFEHVSARALGDIQALNSYQLAKTKTAPLPFPNDLEMVVRCSEALKAAIQGAVQNDRRFVY